ncbi:MAG: hypothetical protein AAGG55_15115 [Pseudomonadota bacterium]
MSFQIMAYITAAAGFLLAFTWFFAGGKLLNNWGMVPHPDGLFVGRRMGAVYLGNAIMLILGASAPASELRTAVCLGLFVSMLLLAVLGLVEMQSERASKSILPGVLIEIGLAAGFLLVLYDG